ncbi:MAG: hypothetical protein AAF203_02980 [Pseudomonadota bacterium]
MNQFFLSFIIVCLSSFASATDIFLDSGESVEISGLVVTCGGAANKNCVGRLASLRPGWGSSSLKSACQGAGADCVVSLAEERPGWGSSSLNSACVDDYGNCAGRLAKERPWLGIQFLKIGLC